VELYLRSPNTLSWRRAQLKKAKMPHFYIITTTTTIIIFVKWVPVTTAWGVLGLRMEDTAPRYGG